MDETRGTLFWNILKILQDQKPAVVILENVRNIAGPRHAHEWEVIIASLREAGYLVSDKPAILSPHRLPPHRGGRPQNRERVFITATYAPDLASQVNPLPVFDAKSDFDDWKPSDWDLAQHFAFDSNVDKTYELSAQEMLWVDAWEDWLIQYRVHNQANPPGFPFWSDDWLDKLVIPQGTPLWKVDFLQKNHDLYVANRVWINQWLKKWNVRSDKFPASRRKFEWQAGDVDSLWGTLMHFRPSGLRAKKPNYVPTLVAITQTSIYGPLRRRLTPREAARLQAFPENFNFGNQPDAATYKQMGNAVNVNVVYQVFKQHCIRDRDVLEKTEIGRRILASVDHASDNPDQISI
jgi:DNA (cytosine-5)-methyltransferase 1